MTISNIHYLTTSKAISSFLKEFGTIVELTFETTFDFRFYAASATLRNIKRRSILTTETHQVLTSNLKVQTIKNPKVNDLSFKLFVGGLGSLVTETHLHRYFSRFGEVKDVMVMKNKESWTPRGFGFVTFKDCAVLDELVEKDSSYHKINDIKVECKPAVTKDELAKSRFLDLFISNKQLPCRRFKENLYASTDSSEERSN